MKANKILFSITFWLISLTWGIIMTLIGLLATGVLNLIKFAAKLIQNIICFFQNPTENQLQKKLEEYKKLSFLIGKQVQVFPIINDAKSSYTATVLDIDNNANLVVQTNGKIEVLNSGEVSLKI